MFAEDCAIVKQNRKILDKFPGKMYIVNTVDEDSADCKYLET